MVEGIGEQLTPLPFAPRSFLLCIPPFGVNTAQVYAAWDERPEYEGPNALTGAALRVEPRLAAWREALAELSGQTPVLAGSGSTWFVEDAPAEAGTRSMPTLAVEEEWATLVRVATVPSGWSG
jgi:4-diphosphocytidyl-2C-methyl-D-erythritol kinase